MCGDPTMAQWRNYGGAHVGHVSPPPPPTAEVSPGCPHSEF